MVPSRGGMRGGWGWPWAPQKFGKPPIVQEKNYFFTLAPQNIWKPLQCYRKENKKPRGPSETNLPVLPLVPSTRVSIVSDPPMPQLFMTHSIVLIYIVVKILEFVSQILRFIMNSMEKDFYLYNQSNWQIIHRIQVYILFFNSNFQIPV